MSTEELLNFIALVGPQSVWNIENRESLGFKKHLQKHRHKLEMFNK
jgi:hypothetical protein